jgi:hypothetical protein
MRRKEKTSNGERKEYPVPTHLSRSAANIPALMHNDGEHPEHIFHMKKKK